MRQGFYWLVLEGLSILPTWGGQACGCLACAWCAAVFRMHPLVITKGLFYKWWLWQQLQAPLPCRIDINPHSNQTPLKHAPVEWNFLLNKVLLTQLPALWARAELSSSRRRSTLMNPLKYRLIGIAHWSRQTP